MPAAHRAPGPSQSEAFRMLLGFRKDPLGALLRAREQYGDFIRWPLFDLGFVASSPQAAKHVLQDNHLNYRKGFEYERIKPLVGEGLLTSDGELWKRQRRLAQPAFHRQRIAAFARQMAEHTGAMLDRWSAARAPIDLVAEMVGLTLANAGTALFSADLSQVAAEVGPPMDAAFEILNRRIDSLVPLPLWLPTRDNVRLKQAIARLERVVYGLIARGRREGGDRDLLGMLMAARDEATGEGMSDHQLRDEVMTMLIAGHETTSNALCWTFFLLSQHPEVESRLHEEVDAALAGRPPGPEDLARLPYLASVLDESMRLYPPAWIFSRKAIREDEVCGFPVRAGATIVVSSWVIHRHPDHWPDPERFDPSRFAPGQAEGRPRFAYLPFAGGPRMCIGNAFATMEAQLVIALVAQRFRVRIPQPEKVRPDPSITLRPKGGIPAVPEPRGRRPG